MWARDRSLLGWFGVILGALGAAAAVLPGELRSVGETQGLPGARS